MNREMDDMSDQVGVLLVQVGYDKNSESVLEKAVNMIDEAHEKYKKLDIVCMPELYYEGDKKHFIDTYKKCAIRNNVNIITGSMPVMTDSGKPTNTTFVIDRKGNVLGDYSKAHMFDAYEDKESDRIQAGDHIGIFDLDIGKIGVVICYDIRFSEYVRTLALKGIDILMVPAAFYRPRTDDWEVLLRAASLYNIMYVCAANQFGKRCAGRSSVADPDGRIVARASDCECSVYHILDLGYQRHMREVNPSYENRRPDLYDI